MENNHSSNSNDSPSASVEPCVDKSEDLFDLPSADDHAHPSNFNQQSATMEAASMNELKDHVASQDPPEATDHDQPMLANSEMKKQMTILDPALAAAAVPSAIAPTVYALASKVPFPTINHLTMNIPNQPVVQEKVAVPFKTILCSPPNETTNTPQDRQHQSPEYRSKAHSSATAHLSESTMYDDPDQMQENDTPQNNVHPYFAAAKFPERPPLSRSRSQHSSAESMTGSQPKGLQRPTSGMTSPPLTTNLTTASSNSDTVPVHHVVFDENLDPGLVKKNTNKHQQAQDDEAAAASSGNNSIGSRSTVFGFAPLYGKGDHQAAMSSGEERVLKESLACRTIPLSGRLTSAHNNESGAISGAIFSQSPTEDGQPQATPHARAGISRTLNLDQLESGVEPTVPDSEESVESLIETKDWSKTGLGPRSSWPAELNMLMPLLMRSASPLALYWGDQNYLIYNDAWRPILKQKHPLAMGMPGATVWSEIWDVLGAQIDQVRKEGRGNDNKGLRLDLHREGYEEECYFDFTFSPIFLSDNSIGGIFACVLEVTQSILNQRRLMTLNQFSKQAPLIQSVTGAYSMITTILQESNNLDIPFSIVYSTKELAKEPCPAPTSHGTFSPPPSQPPVVPPVPDDILTTGHHAGKCDARRAPQAAILRSTSFDRKLEVVDYGQTKEKIFSKATSTRHIPDSLLITPEEYEPLDPSAPIYDDPWAWPVRSVLADGIPRLVTLPKSTHKLARAILLPILENPSVLDSRITTILIVGINPFQMLDNQYLDFLALLVANIASLLHFGRSREEERKTTEALFELNKAKISFFQNISHELRTPLTLMLAPLDDVLAQTPEKAPTRANLEMIRRNSRRLLKLVNTLLQFSRIEAGKGLAVFEETDLSKATREVSANFESVARGFNLDYIIDCEDLSGIPGGIWVDQAMWAGIILNLIGNAFKHTWSGSVTVHQYPAKGKNGRDGVAVDVADTGVGISADHLHSLFGRFNRIENKQSRSHEGTGIGLSLVKELTEVHGGNVSVTSEVDKGTCFHLWIPAGRSHLPSSQIKLGDSNEAGQNSRTFNNDIMNNKTDASMYVEEATQWISQKSLPGSTLTASGTDSTEEEKPEDDDDDAIHLGLDHMRDRQGSVESNQDYEVSTLDVDEEELSRILIDPPEDGEVVIPEEELAKLEARRSSSTVHSPRLSTASAEGIFAFKEQAPSAISFTSTERVLDTGMNDDGGFGSQEQTRELIEEPEDDKAISPRARSRRSYIIIVDDNNDMRTYLREILGKDFRVRCAVDGLDAIRLISERLHQRKRIDLVLSDVAMPNMNGYELLKRLRSDSATMTTPFILLSARAGEEANVEGLDLGADDCLVKPFSARELLARVRSTIRLSDLRHELIREQRHALEMKQLIYSISVRIRSGLSLPQILDTASKELFTVIRCNAIRICRFRRVDPESGQHWVRFVSEIVSCGKPKVLTPTDRLLPKGLEVNEIHHVHGGDTEMAGDLRHVRHYQHPVFGAKNFISVALIHNRRIWGYLLASKDAEMVDWSQSEKLLFEQTGNQISLAIAHASLWEMKKSQQVEMEAAHAANEAKSQILANTSHELRTPIGAIVGALSALEDTDYNLTGEQRDMVKIMQITSDVALSVINDLLDTAKLEAGAMSLTIKECPALADTLVQSVRIFADKAGRKEVDLILEPSEELESFDTMMQQGAIIWTDGDRLQQVIMNLIGNAVKFTSNGKVVIQCSFSKGGPGAVHSSASSSPMATSPLVSHGEGLDVRSSSSASSPAISSHGRIHHAAPIPPDAQVTHGTLKFEVSDTGIGIDPEFLKNHIFKSFAQYDQSMTRRFGGTGLGLAISKHLVMMNGGILGVTSNVGQGSTFYFTWPITLVTRAHLPTSPQRPLTPRPALSAELAYETRAVVVEPVPEARNMLRWILSQQSIDVALYESCDNVFMDEQARNPDLLGPDGKVLVANYRPNAHFFFCTRSSTAEATIRTARDIGELFRAKNDEARLKETQDHRDLIVSIILVVFSSAQGRSLAKDMIKRIRGGGLEQTVLCRYIVKPVKTERVIECLQMQGSYTPFTRGIDVSSEALQGGALKQTGYSRYAPHHRPHQPHHHQRQSNSQAEESGSIPGDYDGDDYCNKNIENLGANHSPISDESPTVRSPPQEFPTPFTPSKAQTGAPTKTSLGSHPRSSTATQRRLRLRANAEAVGGALGRGSGKNSKTSGTDESIKSLSDNPAFSNRAARAAAGKRERKGKCILCVEDNIINLRVVQYQLQKLGYDTQSACDGQVAVDIIKAQIEMLAQQEGAENTVSVEDETTDAIVTESGTDNEIAVSSADDEAGGREILHAHSAIGRELLALNPEENLMKGSNVTEAAHPQVDPSSTPAALRPSLLTPLQSSGASSTSLAPSLLSSSSTSLDQSTASESSSFTEGRSSTGLPPLPTAAADNELFPTQGPPKSSKTYLPVKAPKTNRPQGDGAKIDLILMDCAMPVKSGFDAASEIRAMEAGSTFTASIPIIALTASAVASTKEKCLESGMNGYLSKPTKLADLEEMLDQWIEKD
ncbi:two-component system, sensor histidine kinase and response regulator [Entomortierella parvispora]|uniref:histidine kinase n=1 Tax=Entomortierella parvispora TaxID=205924 RepID=A0A9P3GZ44_9FUNG|nr:two-component system, sensor histidine kinase and response regulator [Entomortierella parvispora]